MKNANQKVLSFLLTLFMLLSLCACEKEPITPDPPSVPVQNTEPSSDNKTELLTVNGAPISDWTIAVDPYTKNGDAVAEEIATFFASYTGERMQIMTAEALTGREKNLICIGALGRNMDFLYPFSGDYYLCDTDKKGSVISLISTQQGFQPLIERLKNEVREERKDENIALILPDNEYIRYSVEDDFSAWHLKEELKEDLFDGVTYISQHFIDEDGKRYYTFALILDPDKVSFEMGASNDGYALTPQPADRQTTLQHMQAAVANGKNVIAGVNANFFQINGDYSPKGLALKDGVLINRAGTIHPFFAVTEDGECIIDEAATYRRYERSGKEFVQGVAGNEILMKNGLLTGVVDAEGIHPRTLVGISADGKIIFGVIDGRQPEYSNGASYASSAIWMRTLGARTVMNLDGGGSSNLVLRNPDTNSYNICNSPSDGQLRKIYNSVLVVLKESE